MDQRICASLPLAGTAVAGQYARQVPPEARSGEPYDPFKLDVWQVGASYADFSVSETFRLMRVIAN